MSSTETDLDANGTQADPDEVQHHVVVTATRPEKSEEEVAELRALLLSGDPAQSRAAWEKVKRGLDQDRSSKRKLFP